MTWLSLEESGGVAPHYARYLAGEPLAAHAPARRCPDLDALEAFGRRRLGSRVAASLADALLADARRLGAGRTSADAIEAVRAGEAVLVFAGQQPGLLGGPLYCVHKASTAVAAARALRARGVPAHPAFWIASDDADLDETGTAYAPGPDRALRKARFHETYARGTASGDVPASENLAALGRLLPGAPDASRVLIATLSERGADLGGFLAAFLHRLFPSDGLVTVDSRTAALREAAAPLLGRYLDVHEEIGARIERAGEELEARGWLRPLHAASATSALFRFDEEGRRLKLETPERARGLDPRSLSSGVVLRPFVQESIFPSAGMVVGPGELAYLVQTEGISELLGVERSPYLPRLSATWADDTLFELSAGTERGWGELFEDPGALIAARLRALVPEAASRAVAALRRDLEGGFARVVRSAESEGDAALAEIARAARKKADYQVGRVEAHLVDRARREASKRGLVLTNVAEFLRPRRGGQERTFSSMWPLTTLDPTTFAARTIGAACAHLRRVGARSTAHAILSLDPRSGVAGAETMEERCESA